MGDLNLPGKDGIEFLRSNRSALAGTGIVLLSGEDERILHSVTALGRSVGLNVLAALTKGESAAPVLLRPDMYRPADAAWRSRDMRRDWPAS